MVYFKYRVVTIYFISISVEKKTDRYIIDVAPWNQYAAYAVVTSISKPCGDFEGGGH